MRKSTLIELKLPTSIFIEAVRKRFPELPEDVRILRLWVHTHKPETVELELEHSIEKHQDGE